MDTLPSFCIAEDETFMTTELFRFHIEPHIAQPESTWCVHHQI